jgi:RNA polymerase sigma-70 factor (ECF subfamily)
LDGDKRAWVSLVRRHEQSVYNYALRMTGRREDALDLMQEVFVAVYRNLHSFRGESGFKHWLFRIAHFRAIDFFRSRQRWQELDQDGLHGDGAVDALPGSCDPEQEANRSIRQRRLSEALAHLPLAQRQVVELKFFEQFTFEQIAEQSGVSDNTVKSRLYAALNKLKDLIDLN